jgi:hypothetical protein
MLGIRLGMSRDRRRICVRDRPVEGADFRVERARDWVSAEANDPVDRQHRAIGAARNTVLIHLHGILGLAAGVVQASLARKKSRGDTWAR